MRVHPLLLALVALAPLASAQEPAPAKTVERTGWEFEIVPYLWTASLDGSTRVGNLPTADVDADFGALFENLDMALATFAMARHGKFSLLADVSYTDLGLSAPKGPVTVDVNGELFWTSLALGYTFSSSPDSRFDVFAGARYYNVELSGTSSGPLGASATSSSEWVDPVVGVLATSDINEKVQVSLLVDVGGFGAGSNMSYEIMPAVSYSFSKVVSGKLGFRLMDVEYESSDLDWDMTESGLLLALGFRF